MMVKQVTIKPVPDRTSVQSIRLHFLCANQSEPTVIEFPAREARFFADSLLEVLNAGGNTPTPSTRALSGARGKPKLRIVR